MFCAKLGSVNERSVMYVVKSSLVSTKLTIGVRGSVCVNGGVNSSSVISKNLTRVHRKKPICKDLNRNKKGSGNYNIALSFSGLDNDSNVLKDKATNIKGEGNSRDLFKSLKSQLLDLVVAQRKKERLAQDVRSWLKCDIVSENKESKESLDRKSKSQKELDALLGACVSVGVSSGVDKLNSLANQSLDAGDLEGARRYKEQIKELLSLYGQIIVNGINEELNSSDTNLI